MTALAIDPRRRTAMLLAVLVVAMVGLAFASVPLYRLFCEATGYGGTTRRALDAAVPGAVAGKTVTVRFDANHASSLPWTFTPEVPSQTVTLWRTQHRLFHSDQPVRQAGHRSRRL